MHSCIVVGIAMQKKITRSKPKCVGLRPRISFYSFFLSFDKMSNSNGSTTETSASQSTIYVGNLDPRLDQLEKW